MALPTLKLPTHKITLPFSKQEIEIRPYVIKEEGTILTMLEGKKTVDVDVTDVYKRIISNCVVTKDFVTSKLNMHDFFYLIIQIRMKSHGEVVETISVCDKCKKKSEFDLNLEEAIKVSNEDKLTSLVKINKELVLEITTPNIDVILDLSESKSNNVEYTIQFVANSITKVIWSEKIYKDFAPAELITNILENLTQKEFKKITKEIEQLAKLILKFNFTCMHCGQVNQKTVDNVMDFF